MRFAVRKWTLVLAMFALGFVVLCVVEDSMGQIVLNPSGKSFRPFGIPPPRPQTPLDNTNGGFNGGNNQIGGNSNNNNNNNNNNNKGNNGNRGNNGNQGNQGNQ